MLVAASAEDIFGVTRIPFEEERALTGETLNIPQEFEVPCYLALGYPKDAASHAKHVAIETRDRLHHEGWQTPGLVKSRSSIRTLGASKVLTSPIVCPSVLCRVREMQRRNCGFPDLERQGVDQAHVRQIVDNILAGHAKQPILANRYQAEAHSRLRTRFLHPRSFHLRPSLFRRVGGHPAPAVSRPQPRCFARQALDRGLGPGKLEDPVLGPELVVLVDVRRDGGRGVAEVARDRLQVVTALELFGRLGVPEVVGRSVPPEDL